MTLAIAPILPSGVAQAATLDVALQPGTVVTAQVLKLLDANLVRIAIANLTLDVITALPLQPGQSLQVAVTQTKDGVSLAPVLPETTSSPRGAAVVLDDIPLAPKLPAPSETVRPALSPVEARAVTSAAQIAVTKQTGLSPLFANLTAAATSGSLPQPVLVAAAQLLALRQPRDQPFTGAEIKAALASSGLVREASLASGASAPIVPDIKSALVVLRQTLATWVARQSGDPQADALPKPTSGLESISRDDPVSVAARTTAAKLDPAALVTVAEGEPSGQREPGAASSALAPPSRGGTSLPPPFRDALPAAQSVATSSIAPEAKPDVVARQLIADTDGALARQTLLQIASLPDRVDTTPPRNETIQPRWNFEIPFVTPQGTAMGQFEIARDGDGEAEAAQRIWRARFSLDIEPAGPVHALISFSGETTSVKMWAERPATAAQLRANAAQLGASLDRADLRTGNIVIADGAPTRAQAVAAGHFLNRAS